MVRKVKLWDPKKDKFVSVRAYKKPKGFINFTDLSEKKGLMKAGYKIKVGRNPYSARRGKVLFYKKK